MSRKVMVFGVFDGVHEGHRSLFRQAKDHGDYLIAVVTQDIIVQYLKGRLPRHNLPTRIEALEKEKLVDQIALGDAELGTYEVVKKYRPEIIVLGYDQTELKKDFKKHLREFDWKPKIVIADANEPEKYHSSLLDKKKKIAQ